MQISPESSPAKSYFVDESSAKMRCESRFENWNTTLLRKSGEDKLVFNQERLTTEEFKKKKAT